MRKKKYDNDKIIPMNFMMCKEVMNRGDMSDFKGEKISEKSK